jgi:acyl phosphate:glycerol-3-phosphate acyltransferase
MGLPCAALPERDVRTEDPCLGGIGRHEPRISGSARRDSSTFTFELPRRISTVVAVDVLRYAVAALGAYLLGSLPTGFLVAKARGMDIRTAGSGNIGATNAFRVLGKPAGILVLAVDGLKGFTACFWFCDLVAWWFSVPKPEVNALQIVAGVAAVLGHNFPCWLNFKGGKGIATSAGAYFALAPLATGIALGVWVVTLAASRYVSLASIAAAVALPTAVWLKNGLSLGIVTTALGAMAIWKHKGNIERLLHGTERRMGQKPPAQEVAK